MLRVLDIGCHDGFVNRWIMDKRDDVEFAGLELNSLAAERARERGVDCYVGDSFDAPKHWPEHSFDAVVSYEVIEHVPDVPTFLESLERMVKPGGRIYLSSPDGTYGEGGNPHHLRALRSIDLMDISRRRGKLRDAEIGSDGITTVAYTPSERFGDIAIYCGPGWEQWAPHDIERRGLGGSETAAVRLAHELSELGWIVTVYASVEQCAYRDVIFRSHEVFDPLEPRAGLICSRIPEVAERVLRADTTMLWLHDVDAGERLTPQRAGRFDHIFALSRWHEDHLRRAYPFAEGRVRRIRNGIYHSYFTPRPWDERAQRVLYTSSPDRGLDVLLELWPEVLKRVPEAELHHCYAEVYDKIADQDETVAAHREKIRELSDQPGVVRLGSLSQPELAALMCESRVWAHPSWVSMAGGPFHETFCIGAAEAQAAGCHVVASDWGALHETVRVGALVDSEPLGDRWKAAFVDEIVRGLTDPDCGEHAVRMGPPGVSDLGWGGVAEEVAALVKAGWRRR